MTLEMLNLQPRYKEAVWGSEYFMAIGERRAKNVHEEAVANSIL